MSLHDMFGRHLADTGYSHWEGGRFVSRCTVCQREMVKLPGMAWGLSARTR